MTHPTTPYQKGRHATFISKIKKTIRRERAYATLRKSQLDATAEHHQSQMIALSQMFSQHQELTAQNAAIFQLKLAEARKQALDENTKRISNLKSSLSSLKESLEKATSEKNDADQALKRARDGSSQDAMLISQLREELKELRQNKEKLIAESIEKHTRNMQLVRKSKEADSKVSQYEESNSFLRAEVKRLTTELFQYRSERDELDVTHEAALATANKSNIELSEKLASANLKAEKLTSDMSKVERHIIDMQAEFEREKSDHIAQIESLKQLVDMHREEKKDAEIRLAGYNEVLKTLAEEKQETGRQSSQNAVPSLDKHAEVLFKNLNQVLDAKLDVLESERHELIRSRAAEARMATKQQALIREAETAKREAQEARRQNVLLEAELVAQKDNYDELRRNSAIALQENTFNSPSVLPRTQNTGMNLPINRPSFGYGTGIAVETPTPFRNAGRVGQVEQALAGLIELRRRHEAILNGLREKRKEYGDFYSTD